MTRETRPCRLIGGISLQFLFRCPVTVEVTTSVSVVTTPFSQTVNAINTNNINNINIAATDDFASGLYLSIRLFIRQAAKYLILWVGSVLTQQNKNANFGN